MIFPHQRAPRRPLCFPRLEKFEKPGDDDYDQKPDLQNCLKRRLNQIRRSQGPGLGPCKGPRASVRVGSMTRECRGSVRIPRGARAPCKAREDQKGDRIPELDLEQAL